MKSRSFVTLAAIGASLLAGTPHRLRAADSIVPPGEQIDEGEARLTYARLLAQRRETWADAVTAYERLLRDQPAHATALAELAEMRVRQGDLAAAERPLRHALTKRADDPAAVAALGRLLLWTNRPQEAEELLAGVLTKRALTKEEQQLHAESFSRLGRHREAQRVFDTLLASGTPSGELLSAAADARLASGDVIGARDLYRRALEVTPTLAGAKRGYALTLAWSGDDATARGRLEEALRAAPQDADVIHTWLSTIDRLEGVTAAIARAKARAEAAPQNAQWRAEWAELEARRGHATVARELFAQALALTDTPELRLRAGRAAITWGDFYAAEKALREALARRPGEQQTRDELGQLLLSADRLEEAEQHYERWSREAPTVEAPMLGLVRVRLKEKDFAAAVARCDALLTLRPDHPLAMRLKADALVGLRRAADAAQIWRQLGLVPGSQVDAELALGRIARQNKNAAEAETHFAAAWRLDPTRPAARFFAANASAPKDDILRGAMEAASPDQAAALVEWAGLYAEAGDFGRAVRSLQTARTADCDYFPAWLQLAEFLAIDAQFDASLKEFADLKKIMPGNRQILLGEARALAWSRRYEEALRAYAALAALNPADPVPRREAARTAGWAKERARGAELYTTAWSDQPVDRQLGALLAPILEGAADVGVVGEWKHWTQNPAAASEPFAWTERFAHDRFVLRDSLPEARATRVEDVYLELLPALRLQRAWWLENLAKQLAWDRRYASAEATFQRLIRLEPGNEEALFDLSQAQAAQGLGAKEHATLAQLLTLDANHSLANHAVRRREIRSQPLGSLETYLWRERGRGELSSLRRTWIAGEVQDTFRDQINGRVGAILGREAPLTRDGQYAFRGVSLAADAVANPWLSGSASFLHREFYDGRIGHADSGQAQLWAKRDSRALGLGYERREELANEFGLFQGTRSDNAWLGGLAALTRKLDVEGRLTATRFSDGNTAHALLLRPAYQWTDHPRVFKTILTLGYRDTDAASTFVRTAGKLTDIVHPYWTPQNYLQGALTLEWFHDLAREFFVGSEERFYDLRLTFGTDTDSNPSITFEGDWQHEWADRWLLRASAYLNFSAEWDAIGLRLRLARRF